MKRVKTLICLFVFLFVFVHVKLLISQGVTAGPDKTICPGETVTLDGAVDPPPAGVTYCFTWRDHYGNKVSDQLQPAVTPSKTTIYTFKVSNTKTMEPVGSDQVKVFVIAVRYIPSPNQKYGLDTISNPLLPYKTIMVGDNDEVLAKTTPDADFASSFFKSTDVTKINVAPAQATQATETLVLTGVGAGNSNIQANCGALNGPNMAVMEVEAKNLLVKSLAIVQVHEDNDDLQLVAPGVNAGAGVVCVADPGLPLGNLYLDTNVDPDDFVFENNIYTGEDGICQTPAIGDDNQIIDPGNGLANQIAIIESIPGGMETVPSGDDVLDFYNPLGRAAINTGPNGICETYIRGNDFYHSYTPGINEIYMRPGHGRPEQIAIDAGDNGTLESQSDDELVGSIITTGPDGVCQSNAVGPDDFNVIPFEEGRPNQIAILPGNDEELDTEEPFGGDDQQVGNIITTGNNGICETEYKKGDYPLILIDFGEPNSLAIEGGINGLQSIPQGDDYIVGNDIVTGINGKCETPCDMGDYPPIIAFGRGRPNALAYERYFDKYLQSYPPGGDDIISGAVITTGNDGVCQTDANGDDFNRIPQNEGEPNTIAIISGPDGILNTDAVPDDEIVGDVITTGDNGICQTQAAGDDIHVIDINQGKPHAFAITPGPDGVRVTPNDGDDEKLGGSKCLITIGANGTCETTAAGDDDQVIPNNGIGDPNSIGIAPGDDGILNTNPGGDDQIRGDLFTGLNGICNTDLIVGDIPVIDVNCGAPNQPAVFDFMGDGLQTPVGGDDEIRGTEINTGPNGICNTIANNTDVLTGLVPLMDILDKLNNKVYNQAIFKWSPVLFDIKTINFDLNYDNFFNNYIPWMNSEMIRVRDECEKPTVCNIFYLDNPLEPNIFGLMLMNQKFGFVFPDASGLGPTSIAHELGHGGFGLTHESAYNDTENLMYHLAYPNPNKWKLNKNQIKKINP